MGSEDNLHMNRRISFNEYVRVRFIDDKVRKLPENEPQTGIKSIMKPSTSLKETSQICPPSLAKRMISFSIGNRYHSCETFLAMMEQIKRGQNELEGESTTLRLYRIAKVGGKPGGTVPSSSSLNFFDRCPSSYRLHSSSCPQLMRRNLVDSCLQAEKGEILAKRVGFDGNFGVREGGKQPWGDGDYRTIMVEQREGGGIIINGNEGLPSELKLVIFCLIHRNSKEHIGPIEIIPFKGKELTNSKESTETDRSAKGRGGEEAFLFLESPP
ncbi:hypothetical protein PRIPAC_92134 [Pristionchus pacificus]|nr:hypothetical protein PRIPAC_92134 [Pristionchus pacificus]|eukprot:PDM62982.1 hypothetical protein PRIPAC_50197 [Pristionchus pacificus]